MPRTTRQRQPIPNGQKRRNEKITWMPSKHPAPPTRSPVAPVEENLSSDAMYSSYLTFHNYSAVDNHTGPVVTSHSRMSNAPMPVGKRNSLGTAVSPSLRTPSSSSSQ